MAKTNEKNKVSLKKHKILTKKQKLPGSERGAGHSTQPAVSVIPEVWRLRQEDGELEVNRETWQVKSTKSQ